MDHPLVIHIPLTVISETEPIKLKVVETGGGMLPVYQGETRITPKCYEDIELETARKTVLENIVVEEIPYYETSNVKGTTFIVGGN